MKNKIFEIYSKRCHLLQKSLQQAVQSSASGLSQAALPNTFHRLRQLEVKISSFESSKPILTSANSKSIISLYLTIVLVAFAEFFPSLNLNNLQWRKCIFSSYIFNQLSIQKFKKQIYNLIHHLKKEELLFQMMYNIA